jgi:hypothetical protein
MGIKMKVGAIGSGRVLSSMVPAAIGLVFSLSGCQPVKSVIVPVVVPPPIVFPGVKEMDIEEFQGPAECAKGLKPKLVMKVTESGIFTIAIPILSEPSETLTVKGTVTTCTLSLGSGTLNVVLSAWYMGNQVHQAVIDEQTNRPGAPPNEVRDVLVERVANRVAKATLPIKRKEIRTFLPIGGDGDAGVTAASMGNWSLAIDSFGKQIKDQPKEHRAWYNRGIAYEATGQLKLGMNDLQKAIELHRCDRYVEALARLDKGIQSQKTIELIKKNAE